MNDLVLHTKNLTKKYKNHKALDNVNIKISKGDIYGLVGKNGAGKTTLMRIITGLSLQDNGDIELFSKTSKDELNKERMRTGCIIETPSFFPYLSGKKNLEYYRIQKGIPEKDCVDKVLNTVGLSDTGNKKFKHYSLGMKQRLGLALALIASPDFLILDEPINGLDPVGIVMFRDILKKLNREKSTTILISSHILGELSQLATTYGFIDNGKLIEQISAKDLEEKCREYLSVKVDDAAHASLILEKNLNCTSYQVLPENEIKIFKYLDKPEMVSEAFIKNGIKVYSISKTSANLENYFMDLIGGGINA
ncbi:MULTISPECIES: ATP-binding cassette domain-containing protein [Clostridium]|uniref:Putative ABC transporter ATP-binding protein YxlF n=1 Tax=Clostridium ragsdalei P11 TaxID=1353534 RepID=A0A1A6AIC3_9CLOT|nr:MULTISPECIES: ATP-binding cassette domain-containing protein [Clostridium]OBR89817.1 putative ABC transporter ATP-binding protein YxlF [Clostridium ragsdalei P11]QXE19695.1 bacitracin ABC transporter ATP-binding protein [Clostridium sp. 001]